MKVFEVHTEFVVNGETEIRKEVQYVIAENNDIRSVVDYFTDHCEQYEKELKGVREVLTIVQRIPLR